MLARVEGVLVEDRLEIALAGVLVPAATLRNNDRLVELEVLKHVRTGPLENENLLIVDLQLFQSVKSRLSEGWYQLGVLHRLGWDKQ